MPTPLLSTYVVLAFALDCAIDKTIVLFLKFNWGDVAGLIMQAAVEGSRYKKFYLFRNYELCEEGEGKGVIEYAVTLRIYQQ